MEKKIYAPFKLDDYRVVRPMIYMEKGGDTVAAVHRVSSFIINKCKLSFITPNVVTLFYNKSWKEYAAAKAIFDEVIEPQLVTDGEVDLASDTLSKVYDYFEHIQSSVISIYSAIEALCNAAIPTDYSMTKKNTKGITEIWDKVAIEKWMSTEEKVGKLIPDILQIASPKTLEVWEHFKALKAIRDAIIHQKHPASPSSPIDSGFLSTLLDPSIGKTIMAGFKVVQYFCNAKDKQVYFPILTDEVHVDVNIVESFDGMFTFNSPNV